MEELIDQARFPALKNVRDLRCRSTREGLDWALVLKVCAARGVVVTDGADNI